tara:strand:+ start:51095 stop:51829 length:735 start_codon:yes stop_codon:yes gene_type:complete
MKKIKFKNEFWCIVTARKNSKSIKRKNTVKIRGKELIKFSFNEITKLKKIIKKTIVTTDDPIIKKISKKYKFEIIHREDKLSGDLINSVDVVMDVLNKSIGTYGYLPKFFFLIQPTSIFLKSEHINKLIKKLNSGKYKSAQTIITVPHQFHAYNQRYLKNHKTGFIFEKKRMQMHNKEAKPIFYAYGNLIASKTDKFIKNKNFFLKPSFGLPVKNIFGFDVDNKFDLKIVKQLLTRKISSYEKN